MRKGYYAIIIPGGGLKEDGSPYDWTIRRLDRAMEVFTGNELVITLGRSTTHKPPILDDRRFPIDESVASADYLARKGVDPKRILLERTAFDTVGNAYFVRVMHTDPRELSRLLVITSAFHMPRTQAIFKWVYGLTPHHIGYEIDFMEVTDKGFDRELISARIRKEKKSLEKLLETKRGIVALRQFHEWLFAEHRAYAYGLNPIRASGDVLQTY